MIIVTFTVLYSPSPRFVRGDSLPARPLLPRPPTHHLTAWLERTRNLATRDETHRGPRELVFNDTPSCAP
eukprot:839269-Prymnesium_polylepis.1